MTRPTTASILITTSLLATGACATAWEPKPPPPESSNVAPVRHRAEILAHLRATLKDPTSVRDAHISQPFLRWMGAGNRYVVCIRFNAKNSFGGYTGPKDHMAVYVAGELSSIDSADDGECRPAVYAKFGELERLR
jgi:hypothetical protein